MIGSSNSTLSKSPTGIVGLDEITLGGLPRGRPTLICGAAGSGKTLLAMEFLVRGATQYDEAGVFITFEEREEELGQNVRSLGFDLDELSRQQRMSLDYVHIERSEIDETGEYNLEGLFIRLGHAIKSLNAKRVALDTIEALFGGLSNEAILRAELRRLFRWLKDQQVTAVITAERGDGGLTRHGLEEYVSDCVISLDHRVSEQRATRRLRIVKYRGTVHGTNEYPFLIGQHGISVVPITSVGIEHEVTDERIPSGIPQLDAMLGGHGYYQGSSVLISGTAGTGKTTLAACLANATAERGQRTLFCSFEESPSQLIRNMRSVGLDLESWVSSGQIRIRASRPTQQGLELHLATIHEQINDFQPHVVIVDPISSLVSAGAEPEVLAMAMRLIDFLKSRQVTAFFTSLTSGGSPLEVTEVGISSLIDTWLFVRDIESEGERNRGIYVLKSRGMPHSNQIREFVMTDQGIQLEPAYVGSEGVLTGSARVAQEARERDESIAHQQHVARTQRTLERRRKAVEAQVAALRAELEAEVAEMEQTIAEQQSLVTRRQNDRRQIAKSRHVSREGDIPGRGDDS